MRYVNPIVEGYPARPFSNPAAAAAELETGTAIRWEPGYGAGYDLLIVARTHPLLADQRWLLDLTTPTETCAIALHEVWTPRQWAFDSTKKPGCWADMRPLLAALGAAEQLGRMSHEFDARMEAEARAGSADGEALNVSDGRLGRKIRRIVEADLARTQPAQKQT